MGRSPKGEGRPRQRKDGTWVQWLDLGYKQGKRLRKKVEGRSREDVKARIAELRRPHKASVDVTARPRTVGAQCDAWLAGHDGRPRTISAYRWAVRLIKERLGDVLLQKLTTAQVRELLRLLKAEVRPNGKQRYAAKSIGLIRTALHQACELAIEDDLLDRNPVDRAKAPKVERSTARPLTEDQARAIRGAARGERLELALLLMLYYGLRRGEVAGLRWEDVQLDGEQPTMTIRGQIGYISGIDGEPGRLEWGPPKSESGVRAFTLSAAVAAAFRWHRTRQETERKAMGAAWKDSPYIFVAETSGGPLNPGAIWHAFRRVMKRAGLKGFRPHDLRHSCATFQLLDGVPLHVVKEFLGHATTHMTMHYAHLSPGILDDAAERVARRLDSRPAEPPKRRRSEGE
jgi:integrase